MIIHKLIARHLKTGADPQFYLLQASDARLSERPLFAAGGCRC